MTKIAHNYEPTSFQKLLLTGQQIAPNSALYNVAYRFDLSGALDHAKFQQAFNQVIANNETMRMRVCEGKLEVVDTLDYVLPITRYPSNSDDSVELQELATKLRNKAATALDLSERCWESELYQIGHQQHIWYLNLHHLVTDGAATKQLFDQLIAYYSAGTHSKETSPPMSLNDYVEFEHKSVGSPRYEKAREFWQNRVDLLPTTKKERVPENPTARHAIVLSKTSTKLLADAVLHKDVRSLSEQLTTFSLLAATLLALRYRLFPEENAGTLGAPFHNRGKHHILAPLIEIGFISVDIAKHKSFAQLVRAIQADMLKAMRFSPPGITTAGMNNCFSWLLNHLPFSIGDFGDIKCKTTFLHCQAADPSDAVRVQVEDYNDSGQLTLHFDLATRLFTEGQQQQFPLIFERLMQACLRNPSADWTEHSLLSQDDEVAFAAFNNTDTDEYNTRVLDLITKQSRSRPDAVALVHGDMSFTYQDLNNCANAHVKLLATTDTVVIALDRSIEAIVAMLSALKAGTTFVPMDITHPVERLNGILANIENEAAFTNQIQIDRGLKTSKALKVDLTLRDEVNPTVRPNENAYTIFTSGSTGEPKGVEIGHSSFANYIGWAAHTYAQNQPLRMPLYSSLAFDLTLTSIFVPLVSGGEIEIYPREDNGGKLDILQVIADDNVDFIKLTPSHLRLLLNTQNASGANLSQQRRLRGLILGGEDLPRTLALDTQQRLGAHIAIFNEYGPTEATIGCMIHQFDAGVDTTVSVPIGHPIANAKVFLRDTVGQPVPVEFDGAMILAGKPLAIGYRNSTHIRGDDYVSGDFARRLPNGKLMYLGRKGNQVKFRGSRIELAEIENAIKRSGLANDICVRLSEQVRAEYPKQCKECGISSNVPRVTMDANGVCNVCRDFEAKRHYFDDYFKTLDELFTQMKSRATATTQADCLVMVSGGKDSSYALCKIVELGLKPVVFTLDNGYLSEHALANVERITTRLNLEWVRACPDNMSKIFADSLSRHSNVCNGCFKTIYTLAINYALEHNIPSIVTGLSRGQLFETRLLDMVDASVFDETLIDQRVDRARIAYHQIDDAVSEVLDVTATRQKETFEAVKFFDFYRYTDVSLGEMLTFLTEFGGWRRPPDTGRSTNCLINDVGIHVHKLERQHHNYAIPYAWDVRMGHKEREEAIDELDDDIDLIRVVEILEDIDYTPVVSPSASEQQLVAYYTERPGSIANSQDSGQALRQYLTEHLPDYAIPTAFVAIDAMPLTSSGKIDDAALPALARGHGRYQAPSSDIEILLVDLLQATLAIEPISVLDNFFELGGDSIAAVQFSAACEAADYELAPTDIFAYPTVAELAPLAKPLSSARDKTNRQPLASPDIGLGEDELDGLFSQLEQSS